jgi:hypothetical protein
MGKWTKQTFLKENNSNGQETNEKMLTISSKKEMQIKPH